MSDHPCPHCNAGDVDVDRGATGLDLCRRCGGLSRAGRPLAPANEYRDFPTMRAVELDCVVAQGVIVNGLLSEGRSGIAVTYVVDGKRLEPIVLLGEQASALASMAIAALRAAQRTQN